MTIRKVERPEWRSFFNSISKILEAKEAEIEVALEGLDHMIRRPREIYVENDAGTPVSIEVIDADGGKQIVKFKDELLLPPQDK